MGLAAADREAVALAAAGEIPYNRITGFLILGCLLLHLRYSRP